MYWGVIVVLLCVAAFLGGIQIGWNMSKRYWIKKANEKIQYHLALCDEMVDELTEMKIREEEKRDV